MIGENVAEAKPKLLLKDTFEQDRPPGAVIGKSSPNEIERLGVDVEGIIGIDHGALRIQPLRTAGWGRAGIAYGPFQRENGLALNVFMLNGHNTSQLDVFSDTMRRRIARWALGSASPSESKTLIVKRLARWIRSDHRQRTIDRMLWWRRLRQEAQNHIPIDENLAVGWFPEATPGNSLPTGSAFVMHALGPENGELWAAGGANPLPTIRGVQNLQYHFVIMLRERGAAYYAASVPDAYELSAYPLLRPLAIEPFRDEPQVYAGIHQSALGQIGFRIDTRVYGVSIASLPQFSSWYGTAHAADSLLGTSVLNESEAETGGRWRVISGALQLTDDGAVGTESENIAFLMPDTPSGLIHVIFEPDLEAGGEAGLIWRADESLGYWKLSLNNKSYNLGIVENGTFSQVASGDSVSLSAANTRSVQILDDGKTFAAYLNGTLLFNQRFEDARLGDRHGVGVYVDSGHARIHHFEAHPRTIAIPPVLELGKPWYQLGQQPVFTETFDGEARQIEGKRTTTGGKTWKRTFGAGMIDVQGDGTAKVHATPTTPNPGRTAFTVDWDYPEFADLELTVAPPGTDFGEGEKGRCGVIFWQDEDNYIIVATYLDDLHPGVSISSFFYLNGFEELYDAVWTNLTRHIYWGKTSRLRVVFDGLHYMALVNDEPVLYRALTDVYPNFRRLSIKRTGLLVNWEWGDDTGSSLYSLVAKV